MQDSQIFYYSALRHLRQITFNKSVIRWIAPQTWMLYKKHVMLAQQICKKKKEICQICWYGQVMNAFPGVLERCNRMYGKNCKDVNKAKW